MSLRIYQEDGFGNAYDENGNEPVEMEVDYVQFPLNDVTNFDTYMDLKPPERIEKQEQVLTKAVVSKIPPKRNYTRHSNEKKNNFFKLVYDKDYGVPQAAKELNVAVRTAYHWYKEDQKAIIENFTNREETAQEEKKKVGRPKILNDEHKEYLTNMYGDDPTATVAEAVEGLTTQFMGLKISKTAVHDHDFMTKECALSMKKAHFEPKDRNSSDTINDRYNWATKFMETDMDFESNCVFIDESAFHINLSRTMAWSTKGTKAVVVRPKTRAKVTTILGAISPLGIINIKVREPFQESSKKRRITGEAKAKKTVGTVTGHYFNFVSDTLDVMDRHEQFKGHYLVMDNAPIHTSDQIEKLILSRGYGCVYLPPYSPELNPIEQFWSVVKSKVKRDKMLKEETLTLRITEACNGVHLKDLKGFCRYSAKKIETCLSKEPL